MSVKLKLLRVQSGKTLEELAQATELTRSYLSKLERGVSTPSISAALRIAKALGVTVEELFAEGSESDPVVINRAPSGRHRGEPGPRLVSGTLPGHKMVAFVLSPTDEPVRNHPMSHHKGEELLFVLKGKISLQLARRTEQLGAGDSAHFNSSIPHKITSVGTQPAKVLLVIASEE
ncbi:transcriptional regulator [Bordetella genomosp. 1]|uniref:Transcriptional regulator n=1 Tax=Bordetella genomosp. 1 TaxID=1395607 RepID=A0A261RUV9_9BORD|nr:XRE family transcriptional regulator [Bordetella genomosp. 1]OZI28725.1 transcriptional regulator [Bordetella genomosp. 1]